VGFTQPTSGTATVEGFDIYEDMDRIYTLMGVCPQHDILWEVLTARQHMVFYGRLKNLKGPALTQAVVEGLKQVPSAPFILIESPRMCQKIYIMKHVFAQIGCPYDVC
jgi:ABC-type multidrug transport system ATPase subunit